MVERKINQMLSRNEQQDQTTLTSQAVVGLRGLTIEETAKFFHVDFTSLLDTNGEFTTTGTLGLGI